MARTDFSFHHRLRVRWAEVDMQAVVFNGNYLTYFDVGFTEYWRATGLPDVVMQAAEGRELFVRKAELEYLSPAHFDDELDICLRCVSIGRSSLQFRAEIYRQHEHLISGHLVYVYADTRIRKAVPIPASWREIIHGFEIVKPLDMSSTTYPRIVLGDWNTLQKDAQAIRYAVFVIEQNIPVELEWDAMDAACLHAVAYNQQGEPIGTGRLLPDGHIGRMAVLASARGTGVGASILRSLMEQAKLRGDQVVRLNAQQSAEQFYAREGFARDGEIFMEAGIAHICMYLKF